MKTIICLGGSIEALPILRRVKELGHRLIVVDGNPDAVGFSVADEYMLLSCYGNPNHPDGIEWSIASAISNCLKGTGWIFPDGIMCAATDAPLLTAKLAKKYRWPGLSIEAATLGTDKVSQILALGRAGIPVPKFFEPRDGFDLDFGSWVVKPIDSRGARGVMRCGGEGLEQCFEQSRAQSPSGRVMVEEWLDGPQLSTESLVQDGKVLFTAVGLRNYSRLDEFVPYCIEDGFDEPYQTAFKTDIDDLIEKSCRALDWYQSGGGVVKGDLVMHNGKLHIIELAPRLSGGLFCAAHEPAYGVDFIGAAIEMALGYKIPDRQPYPRQFVSQRYIFPKPGDIGKRIASTPGILVHQKIDIGDYGIEIEARRRKGMYQHIPHVAFAHYSKPAGHVIQPVTCHADRLGQAMCVGKTPQEARARAERAVREMYNGMVIE